MKKIVKSKWEIYSHITRVGKKEVSLEGFRIFKSLFENSSFSPTQDCFLVPYEDRELKTVENLSNRKFASEVRQDYQPSNQPYSPYAILSEVFRINRLTDEEYKIVRDEVINRLKGLSGEEKINLERRYKYELAYMANITTIVLLRHELVKADLHQPRDQKLVTLHYHNGRESAINKSYQKEKIQRDKLNSKRFHIEGQLSVVEQMFNSIMEEKGGKTK